MQKLLIALIVAYAAMLSACGGGTSNSDLVTANTSATISSSANPSVPGEVAAFTVTVTSKGGGAPTGKVTFLDGTTALGTASLSGDGMASFPTSTLSVGSHVITATYAGDASFAGSTTSAVTQVVQLAPPGSVSPNFFAMDMGHLPLSAGGNEKWPTQLGLGFSIWRSLGASLRWSDLETCDGGADPTNSCYTWVGLDNWINSATTYGQQTLFTAFYTPTWASSNPSASCQNSGSGGCYPPDDVESGDQHWKDFLTAVYNHVQSLPAVSGSKPHISVWECWNEPDVATEYAGQLSDLHTMCNDLHDAIAPLDATAKFTTPAPADDKDVAPWLQTWISGYDPTKVDIIAFHGYVKSQIAEDIFTDILAPLSAFVPQTGKPLWDTEGSDLLGLQPLADPDQHAAFYARYALIQQSSNVATFSYWGYDFGNGDNLIDNPATPNATLNEAGEAWQQIYAWTVGSKFTSPCHPNGTVWQCALTNSSAVPTIIAWDTSQTCSNGVCSTSNFTAPSGMTSFTDIAGTTTNISGGIVPIGAKPVLLK